MATMDDLFDGTDHDLPERYDVVTRLVAGRVQSVPVWSAEDMRAHVAAERAGCIAACNALLRRSWTVAGARQNAPENATVRDCMQAIAMRGVSGPPENDARCMCKASRDMLRDALSALVAAAETGPMDGALWHALEDARQALAQAGGPNVPHESDARCMCKDRPLSACPGEWEPGCDLGSNPEHVRGSDDDH